MKKVIIFSLGIFSLCLRGQTPSVVANPQDPQPVTVQKIIIIPSGGGNSGLSFRKASNSQLASLGCSFMGYIFLRQASRDAIASINDNTVDPNDSYFLSGIFFAAATGFQISYIHHFRQGSKELALEQEMAKLERERIERKIQEIEGKMGK